MSLLKESNTFCRRLGRDDHGVILAMTAVVFLSLFLMASGVMAIGDTIRRRIELQNAVDAAAYAAAMTQADTLSRVAAINKAMAWSWVQSTRLEMDFCFDVFLAHVLKKQRETIEWARKKNDEGNTFKGAPFWGVLGLIPSATNAGSHGGTTGNYEPEYSGGGDSSSNPPMPEITPPGSADSMFSDMTASEAEFAALKKRAEELKIVFDALKSEREDLKPHKADPNNRLEFPNQPWSDTGIACTGSGPGATTCPDCLAWRQRRDQYINDSRKLESDTKKANKKYESEMRDNAGPLKNDISNITTDAGNAGDIKAQLDSYKDQLNDLKNTYDKYKNIVTEYEVLGRGIIGIGNDLKSVIDEVTGAPTLLKGIPATIGVNDHWLISIYASFKRVLYRFENLSTMENLLPSLAIAGQRVRIMHMNDAIENLLFAKTNGQNSLKKRIDIAAYDAFKANMQYSIADIASADATQKCCIMQTEPAEYIFPYNSKTGGVKDDDPEARFLALAGYTDTPRKIFGRGWHTGSNANGWYRRPDDKTIGRFYKQQSRSHSNTARWIFWSSRWIKIDLFFFVIIFPTYIGWGEENGTQQRAGDSWGNNTKSASANGHLTGTTALTEYGGIAKWLLKDEPSTWPRPYYLDKNYFNGKGAINIAGSRKMTNPFAFISRLGMFKAFYIPNDMWAVSSGMAGYRLPAETWKNDTLSGVEYTNISDDGYRLSYADEGEVLPGKVDMNKLWNLRVTDWDAMLMNLKQAGYSGGTGSSKLGIIYNQFQTAHLKVLTPAPGGMMGNPGNDGSQGRFGQLGNDKGNPFSLQTNTTVLWH